MTIGDTTTNLYYSGTQVLEESSGGDYTNRYVWNPANPNSLILRNSGVEVGAATRLWAVSDANNDVVALVLSGSVVERYDYTPSGATTIMNASYTALTNSAYAWINTWGTGRVDSVTGNINLQGVDWNPELQQFTGGILDSLRCPIQVRKQSTQVA